MRKFIGVMVILFSFLTLYSQEEITENSINHSVGIIGTNIFNDYGGYYTFYLNRNSFRLFGVYSTKKYGFSDRLTKGNSSGYGIGFNYLYQFKKFDNSKQYYSKLSILYNYRNLYTENEMFTHDSFSTIYNVDSETHEVRLGYVLSYYFDKIEIQVTPGVGLYKQNNFETNIDYTFYDGTTSPNPEIYKNEMQKEEYSFHFDIEISVGYRF